MIAKNSKAITYDALDISRYIINYSADKEYLISNLKLQKLLYFIQAYFLISEGKPCFRDRIEAWDFGPVVPNVYRYFKAYGSTNIPRIKDYIVDDDRELFGVRKVIYSDKFLNNKDKTLIDAVVDKFKDYSALDLVRITHEQDPWKETYIPMANNEITNDRLVGYFAS